MNWKHGKGRIFFLTGLLLASLGCSYSVPMYGRPTRSSSASSSVPRANDPRYASSSRKSVSSKPLPASKFQPSSVTVKKGDTVYALSRRYNVPLRALIEMNGLHAPFLLSPGQRLKLPQTSIHIVQKGETIYSISRRYSVDMSSLARRNGIRWPYSIFPGQALNLPGSIVAPREETVVARNKVSSRKTASSSKRATSTRPASAPRKKASVRKSGVRLPEPPSRSKGKFAWPLKGTIITKFGPAGAGRHNDGINIRVAEGTYVRAAENGVVAYAGNELKGFGNLLLVKHADGWMTAYAHNREFLVKRGETVRRGQPMAKAGKTGSAKEPQLHFEVRRGTKAVDPLTYLEK